MINTATRCHMFFLILLLMAMPEILFAGIFENPIQKNYATQKAIISKVQQGIKDPIKKSSESKKSAMESKKRADIEAAKFLRSRNLSEKVIVKSKEAQELRNAINEKETQINNYEKVISKYKAAMSDFKKETTKTGEAAKNYLVIFSGLILSLIGNFLSWIKLLTGRKKSKLETALLELELKMKRKEYDNIK